MKTTLIASAIASLALYLLLSFAFDKLQQESKADARQQETTIASIR